MSVGTQVGDQGAVSAVQSVLKSKGVRLRHLDLSHCNLSEAGLLAVLSAAEADEQKTLRQLDLSQSSPASDKVIAAAKALMAKKKELRVTLSKGAKQVVQGAVDARLKLVVV